MSGKSKQSATAFSEAAFLVANLACNLAKHCKYAVARLATTGNLSNCVKERLVVRLLHV